MAGGSSPPRVAVACVLLVCAWASSGATLACAIVLRLRYLELKANLLGDPEKQFMDDCLRDYEGLPSTDGRYRARRRQCIQELAADETFKRLPKIRPTVDAGVCDEAQLCSGGDPGQCADKGAFRDADYRPGDVTNCFQLIGDATKELEQVRRALLLDEAEQKCTRSGRWKDYKHKTQLEYCMWKQMNGGGVCTHDLRTTCPIDGSCCPLPQNHLRADDRANLERPEVYTCRKSPTVGLYCQHMQYRVREANNSVKGDLCTAATCSEFSWCEDFADIPRECLGDVCQDYRRILILTLVCVLVISIAILFDIMDLVLLLRCPTRQRRKAATNLASALLKLLCLLLCYAGGSIEFAREAAGQECLYGEGGEIARAAEEGAGALSLSSSVSAGISLMLSVMSMKWGGQLSKVPYARVN